MVNGLLCVVISNMDNPKFLKLYLVFRQEVWDHADEELCDIFLSKEKAEEDVKLRNSKASFPCQYSVEMWEIQE